ncbi:MAG: ABC transporter permease subunit [Chloroflexi bacterium]|nr:ABC transporter permease subunit [Chloroflexota bacterium]
MMRRGPAFNVFRYTVLVFYAAAVLFPLFWIVSTSVKLETEWITVPATWISARPNLDSYKIVLGLLPRTFSEPFPEGAVSFPSMLPSILNSFVISGGATILALAVGTPAAYSVSRYLARGRSVLVSLLGVRFLPPVVLSIPLLVLFTTAKVQGSHFSVILTYTAYTVPYAVWLMKSFIDDVPRELEEAAISDGCSNFSAFIKIVVPLIARGFAVTGFFIFILNWTEFFLALTLTDRNSITAGFQIYNYAVKTGNLFGPESAGALIALILPVVLGLAIQKYLVRGLTFGIIKAPEADSHDERSGSSIGRPRRQIGDKSFWRDSAVISENLKREFFPRRIKKQEGLFARFLSQFDKPKHLAVLFLLRLGGLLLMVVVFPLLFELYLSFTNWQANIMGNWSEGTWIGLANYQTILLEGRFLAAVGRTVLIVVAALILESSIGLGLALLFVDRFAGKRILTSIILVPMMVIPLVIGFTFYMLFVPAGPVNGVLSIILQQNVSIRWLNNPNLAIIPIILADAYQWTPLMFMIFLAGLVAIPREIENAALILGSSAWQLFRYVSLPVLKPLIIVAVSICGVEAMKIFDIVYVMTRGGPGNQTETIATYFYEVGYRSSRFSYIAAGALIVLVFISMAAMQTMKALKVAEER